MNPGNGIETGSFIAYADEKEGTFTLMNPGNGIETKEADFDKFNYQILFHINESRQRDWNDEWRHRDTVPLLFHINESRQRDWNQATKPITGAKLRAFTLMNPGNGIETSSFPAQHPRAKTFHINESRQRDWNSSKWMRRLSERDLSH